MKKTVIDLNGSRNLPFSRMTAYKIWDCHYVKWFCVFAVFFSHHGKHPRAKDPQASI